jgi:hypothetical protein
MLEADAQAMSNLLARIHRDGGHYESEHGQIKAVDDADLIVAKLNALSDVQQVAVPVPDMFWNHDDADKLYSSISEFLNDEMCSGTELAIGDIRTVQRAVRLPNIDIRITSVNDDECDADYEIVEAQGAKP